MTFIGNHLIDCIFYLLLFMNILVLKKNFKKVLQTLQANAFILTESNYRFDTYLCLKIIVYLILNLFFTNFVRTKTSIEFLVLRKSNLI